MLHAPDFLRIDSAVELAASHRDVVERTSRKGPSALPGVAVAG
jgi:hypothetical protein